ncbi:MAG TPA: nucleotidyltransferase domain-containing protein [Anaerolineae bacterium]|nr:nucleotidyltransferase domain-containing protein [Anaerolineae bacterium]HCC78451.1 nucleotidyltransferase domain-containing protein [Anaerolineae bacterium]HCM96667.1 nucleotidyltransferase domain-containing protein [Anaerolineae bacterium]
MNSERISPSDSGDHPMVETTSQLKTIIRRFRTELEKMGIHVDRVMLYGSQASQTAQDGSDIDLIIISPDFAPYSQRERLEMLGVAAARILESVQANGFTPQEIEKRQLMPFWDQILREQAIAV